MAEETASTLVIDPGGRTLPSGEARPLGHSGATDPYLGVVLKDSYRVERRLGEGGMGAVYLAEHQALRKKVAVKVLGPEFAHQAELKQRFLREARAAAAISDDHVVEIYDFGETPDGSAFIAMEYLEGVDLAVLLQREVRLPWPRARDIALQICQALQAAHDRGIVHRDVKPANCFCLEGDRIKVLDFGIAKVLEGPAAPGAPQSTTGSLLGTPEYMAPELPKGLRPDARVDIYSLGVLMYKLLTGSAPFTGQGYMIVLTRHMFDPVEPPRQRAPERDIPAEAEAIVMRALAKERDDRWPSMVALADAIAASLPGQPSARAWLEGSRDSPGPAAVVPAALEAAGERELAREVEPVAAQARELPPALARADTSPRLGPETLAQGRRLPVRTLLLASGALVAVLTALLLWLGPGEGSPPAPRLAGGAAAGEKLPGGPGAGDEKLPGGPGAGDKKLSGGPGAGGEKLPGGAGAAGGEKLSGGAGAAGGEKLSGRAGAGGEELSGEPGEPGFDEAGCQAVLQPLVAQLRGCLTAPGAEAPVAGGYELQLRVAPQGRVTAIEAAPGSPRIGGEALGCMRVLIAMQSFPGSPRGGRFRMRL